MHYSAIVAALFATGTFAAPGYVYRYHYVTEVVTVYAGQPTASPAVDAVDADKAPCTTSETQPEASPVKQDYVWVHEKQHDQPQQPKQQYVWVHENEQEPEKTEPQEEAQQQPAPKNEAPIAGSYESIATEYHNRRRAEHGAPPLQWDPELAAIAREHASSCVYGHSKSYGGGGYGQNIAAGYKAEDIENLLEAFYDECKAYAGRYGAANPGGDFKSYGHFTQMVWKDTTRLGCATVKCPSLVNASGLNDFTVCNYKSPGNVSGQYGENVGAPTGQY